MGGGGGGGGEGLKMILLCYSVLRPKSEHSELDEDTRGYSCLGFMLFYAPSVPPHHRPSSSNSPGTI